MTAWVQTGKAGDILSILPLIHAEKLRTGEIQNLIVAKEYASLLECLDYVKPVIYPGDWSDFKGALAFAKQNFDRARVPQMHGNDCAFQRKLPSVFMDMWQRCGGMDQWDNLPLVIPFERKPSDGIKTIFYADHSQSSPFFWREDLFKLLSDTFPNHQIRRASGMRLKGLMDFLPHMEASDLIVSVDTSFLHLSAACTKPVIALSADSPDPWRGTPYSKRFAFHCRYGDYEARKVELIAAMNRAVNNMRTPEVEGFKTDRENGYNLGMIEGVNNHRLYTYRYHVDGWKTKLAIFDGNQTQDIAFPKECDGLSLEDGRLFRFKGRIHLAYTCAKGVDGYFRCIQAYGPLEYLNGQWTVTEHIVPKMAGNDFSGLQKNWVFFESGGHLCLIYGVKGPSQLVYEVIGDKIVGTHDMEAPVWPWGQIRGGCVIPFKDHMLRFFHSRTQRGSKHYQFRYYIGAALMEPKAPFRTVAVSSFPILAGDEKWTNCRHWKPNVKICYGVVPEGDGFRLSLGVNDCESATVKLTVSDLNL